MENDFAGTLVYLFQGIHRSFHKELLRKKSNCCMNLHQVFALALLQEHTSMIMKDFANAMSIAAPSATTFVDRLVRLGWAKRKLDRKNRKLVHIAITTSGKRILETKKKEASVLMKQLIRNAIPSDEQLHLQRILKKLLAQIQTATPQVS